MYLIPGVFIQMRKCVIFITAIFLSFGAKKNLGLYLPKLLSDFDETWYVIFSSNLVLYCGGFNSVGKFPRQGGKGKKF